MKRVEVVEKLLSKNFLASPDLFDCYDDEEPVFSNFPGKERPLVLNKDLFLLLKGNGKVAEINWIEFDKSRSALEKGKDTKIYKTFLDILSYHSVPKTREVLDTINQTVRVPESKIVIEEQKGVAGAIVIKNYVEEEMKKKEVSNFVQYFRMRYNSLRNLLVSRPELQGALSINRIMSKRERSEVSFVGMLLDKRKTKNGNYVLVFEDLTGTITVLVNKNKEQLIPVVEDLVLDETVGVVGNLSESVVYAKDFLFADVPLSKEAKRCPDDVAAAFISDVHVGSVYFLEKQFLKFIEWLNEKKGVAGKIKYLFVCGDLVDGVGVFPEQEKNLVIKDIVKQYTELARYFGMIRKDIQVILSPGDHDALRIAHPQPVLSKKLAKDIWALDNVVLVTNPSRINIHASSDFPGFDVLMYHGHGFHNFIDSVESLRKGNAVDNARLIMRALLQKRHLAPSHASTVYIPDSKEDPLVIDKVPDVFVSGHLHKSDVGNYRNVITINCSCWQAQTDFQIKVGNHPDPGKVPVLNLKTRAVEIVEF
ncbi:MAG: DNA-directed DNA polymerase II small subunit [Candidatus Woesearchaeota archaeon]